MNKTKPPVGVSLVDVAEDPERIAMTIKAIGEASKKLLSSGLNKRGLLVLLAASTGEAMWRIEKVLDGLGSLSSDYLQQAPNKRGVA